MKWHDIRERIKNMILAVFESAATVHPEMHSPFSGSMYSIDIMLDQSFLPELLQGEPTL